MRYIGCSNYSGWHLMKALGISERERRQRFVSQQIHYTLEAREAEYELVPIAIDQGLGILVWSPLAGGLLSGKHRRNQTAPEGTRQLAGWNEPPIRDEERLWRDRRCAGRDRRGARRVGRAGGAGLAARPSGGDFGDHRRPHGGAVQRQSRCRSAELSAEERQRLDEVSAPPILYPYWHQLRTASDRLGPADLSLLGPSLKQ